MKPYTLLAIVLLFLTTVESRAATDQQLQAIAAIGELNGIALQCGYSNEVGRIKMSLVRILPKKRELGVWFENSTNNAFMQFMQQDNTCPSADQFATRLDSAVSALEKVYQ